MDYNDLNNENMSDELNNPSSSSLHSNNFTGGLISGINEVKKHSQTDIDAIKNRTGKNEGIGRQFDDEQPKQKSSKPSSLEKKDELDKKNTNEKIDKKEKENPKKAPFKKSKNNEGAPVEAKGFKKFFKNLPLKIKLIALGAAAFLAVFIFLYFLLAFNSFTNSISVFFGIKEAELEGDEKTSNQLFLYTDNGPVVNGKDLTELSREELVIALKDENVCGRGTIGDIIDSIYETLTGGEFRDACHLIRYIRGTVENFEEKYYDYGLKMDVGLILGSVFFGFDQQAMYDWYEDPSNENVVSAGNHFATLENIVKAKNSKGEPLLTADEVMRIIKSTIFEEVYPDFTFDYNIEKNILGEETITGFCLQNNNQFYYNSLTKWEIFMRYNDDEQDNEKDKKFLFGMSGYMRKEKKKVLHLSKDLNISKDEDFLSLTGAGFVYDTNMNLAFESTDIPCNGSMDETEFIKYLKDICPDCEYYKVDGTYENAYNFFNDREITGIVDTTYYVQHIEDPDLPEKDKFHSVPRTYSIWTEGKAVAQVEPASGRAEFDYLKGFAYRNFPGFEEADNDPNLPNFNKDETWTPKKIETILEEIKQRKEEFNEILLVEESGKSTRLFSGAVYAKANYYCEYIYTPSNNENGSLTPTNNQLANMKVNLTDCAGKSIGSTNFKDYILGVTYAEIGISSLDDYTLTQMVAGINYALANNKNFKNGSITMKSGSCRQNWCDVYNGCSRYTASGTEYPSTVSGGAHGYWKKPLSSSQIEKLGSLFDIASQYLLLDSDSGNIYETRYTASVQNRWEKLAKAGYSFEEIINMEYGANTGGGAYTIICYDIDGSMSKYYADDNYTIKVNNTVKDTDEVCENYVSGYNAAFNKKVVEIATNYVNAGKEVGDCSAFVRTVLNDAYKQLGIDKKESDSSTYMMKKYVNNCVDPNNLQPGDLIFNDTNPSRWKNIGHVSIFLGYDENGNYIIAETNTKASSSVSGSRDIPSIVKQTNNMVSFVRPYY
ncbi:MAG: C40 family peptidase [Bacilli bacterium]|nr:C40 family peptidase [Bacilli bacterium]